MIFFQFWRHLRNVGAAAINVLCWKRHESSNFWSWYPQFSDIFKIQKNLPNLTFLKTFKSHFFQTVNANEDQKWEQKFWYHTFLTTYLQWQKYSKKHSGMQEFRISELCLLYDAILYDWVVLHPICLWHSAHRVILYILECLRPKGRIAGGGGKKM